jgi:hypothetical protein
LRIIAKLSALAIDYSPPRQLTGWTKVQCQKQTGKTDHMLGGYGSVLPRKQTLRKGVCSMPNLSKANSKRNSRIVITLVAVALLSAVILTPLLPHSSVSAIDTLHPGQVSGLSNVTKIAAGHIHSLALKSDGTVWAWGNNGSGQLGNNSTTDSCSPVQVVVDTMGTPLTNVVEIAAGAAHSIARKSDGTVWAWGSNVFAQLGDTTTTDRHYAGQVSGVSSAVGIAAGSYHNLALISGGSVKSWGRNNFGQLGDNTTTNRTSGVSVMSLTDATQVGAGGFHSVALRANNSGKLKAWGQGGNGQLGTNSTSDALTPVDMKDTLGVVFTGAGFVAAGVNFTTVTTTGGKVWSTGQDGRGQQGTGCAGSTTGFVKIGSFSGVSKAFPGPTAEHVVSLQSDSSAKGWGRNEYGQVGNGSTSDQCSPATVVDSMGSAVTGFTAISGGGLHSLGLKSDGTVWSWGDNTFCQLGRT